MICDWARGLATLRGSGEGPVVSGAAPLGGFRPVALYFNLPLRESITYYITSHFSPLTSRAEEAELKGWYCSCSAGNSAISCESCLKMKTAWQNRRYPIFA